MEQAERQKTLKAVLHYFYQDNTRSGSHCRYSLQYHLVWIPKYRRSFLVGAIAERLKQILKEIARDYRIRIIAMEVMPDHIHMRAFSLYARNFLTLCSVVSGFMPELTARARDRGARRRRFRLAE
ncbi:MAG: IS200/IS605 family transposase [Acidobacteria bacterium]|nr:IS200/IS605 family transposase [Acidobacteriota bacterium]